MFVCGNKSEGLHVLRTSVCVCVCLDAVTGTKAHLREITEIIHVFTPKQRERGRQTASGKVNQWVTGTSRGAQQEQQGTFTTKVPKNNKIKPKYKLINKLTNQLNT